MRTEVLFTCLVKTARSSVGTYILTRSICYSLFNSELVSLILRITDFSSNGTKLSFPESATTVALITLPLRSIFGHVWGNIDPRGHGGGTSMAPYPNTFDIHSVSRKAMDELLGNKLPSAESRRNVFTSVSTSSPSHSAPANLAALPSKLILTIFHEVSLPYPFPRDLLSFAMTSRKLYTVMCLVVSWRGV